MTGGSITAAAAAAAGRDDLSFCPPTTARSPLKSDHIYFKCWLQVQGWSRLLGSTALAGGFMENVRLQNIQYNCDLGVYLHLNTGGIILTDCRLKGRIKVFLLAL